MGDALWADTHFWPGEAIIKKKKKKKEKKRTKKKVSNICFSARAHDDIRDIYAAYWLDF